MNRKLIQAGLPDERAVSPVIGVILMVAITVILAAVIGTFVLDLGQSAGQVAPQASLSVSTNAASDEITIEHTGGDALSQQRTRIIVENESGTATWDAASSSGTMAVGGSVTLNLADGTDSGSLNLEDADAGNPIGGVDSGVSYTITIIDTESQRTIFETTVTA